MTGKCPLPANWTQCQKEIDCLLSSYYPDYRERIYLKPVFYLAGIEENPDVYPNLAKLCVKHRKRHISIFLKEQGRVPRSTTQGAERVWVLPGVVEAA